MTKKEYNKRYRQEHKEELAKMQKEYYQKNKNKIAEYHKQWYLEKKEHIAEYYKQWREKKSDYLKQWRQDNAEAIKEKQKKYYQDNAEALKEKQKKYYNENREKIKQSNQNRKEKIKQRYIKNKDKMLEYQKQYRRTPIGRALSLICSYRKKDKKHNRGECTLTTQWIIDNIFSKPCHYCGETDWLKIGCDRIDNEKPHTPDNVVPCCKDCNNKKHTKTYEEFCKEIGVVMS